MPKLSRLFSISRALHIDGLHAKAVQLGAFRRTALASLLLCGLLLAACTAWALDDDHGQSAQERAAEVPAGPWQGNWRVTRDDPRITSRAGSEVVRLHIIHDQGSPSLDVSWVAGRAICIDPLSDPCEWADASGIDALSAEVGDDGSVRISLPISADLDDPFTLKFSRLPLADEAVQGVLESAGGEIRWNVDIERYEP